MSFAFCEPPDSGVNASAKADGAPIRDANRAAPRVTISRRVNLDMPGWGKGAGSYLRPCDGIHFVADATQGRQAPWKAALRFSTKALTPSWKSLVRARACWS